MEMKWLVFLQSQSNRFKLRLFLYGYRYAVERSTFESNDLLSLLSKP